MSCEAIAKVLLLDDDTIRTWYRLYEEDGIEGLASFGYEGGTCRLNEEQQDKLKAYVVRRIAEGHSKLEGIRCVKRYIAREVFSLITQGRREINQLSAT